MKTFPVRRSAGFTLVELMIATSISGVLASVAYPSFSGALRKIHRTEAMIAMLQLQQAQERWRSASSRYGSLAEIGVAEVAPGRNYLLSVTAPSPSGYMASAVAVGAQAGDRGCRYMKISVESGNLAYSSGDSESTANNEQANRRCWNL